MSAQTPPAKPQSRKPRSARRPDRSGARSDTHESLNGVGAPFSISPEHPTPSAHTLYHSRGSKRGIRSHKRGNGHANSRGEPDTAYQYFDQDQRIDYTRVDENGQRCTSGAVSDSATLDGTVHSRKSNRYNQEEFEYTGYKHTNTPSKQAYAGPLFHASPAASSLPLPKQFSKSPAIISDSATNGHDSTKSPCESPDSMHRHLQSSGVREGREASPLDILFNAQRAERERARTAMDTSFGDPAIDRSARYSSAPSFTPSHQSSKSIGPTGEVFPEEMDGISDPSDSEEPTTTLPFKERLHAVRSTSQSVKDPDEERRQAKTRALKQLLMTPSSNDLNRGSVESSSVSATGLLVDDARPVEANQNEMPGAPHADMSYGAISTHQKPPHPLPSAQSPAQPTRAVQDARYDQRGPDIKSMEENLRKMLKLGGT